MRIYVLLIGCLLYACADQTTTDTSEEEPMTDNVERPEYVLVIHGGAGVMSGLTDEQQVEYRNALDQALNIGEAILSDGGDALDAVVETIKFMEDNPLFNAGKGAVFTHDGINEMDASIMDGRNLNAGAIGGITNIKNPITAARAVLEKSDHVLLTGKGAEEFAGEQGLELVDPSYFYTEARWQSLQRAKENAEQSTMLSESENHRIGTVGAAALDKAGNLAAGTSTGGMTNKKYNRLGDSPIIGAGTYANNATCAVSSTGHGEYFIRYAVAHDISAIMEYTGVNIIAAADKVIMDKLVTAGGDGGIIGVDKDGNVAMPFNTPGMHRGFVRPGERYIGIYKD